MAQTTLNVRMDDGVKRQFDAFCADVGMNASVAVNLFAKTVIRERRIPFEISLDASSQNRTTIAEARSASERIWQASAQNGTDTMTMDEINAEIAATRKEKLQ
ncbi:hypothetical protein AGMMS50229_14620 [Campylobacterota bacterium]|nr:hypothetical protein AGMMS50229_14620 [Campylobacterota bacterium]